MINYPTLIDWIAKQKGLKPVDARLILGEFYISKKCKYDKKTLEKALSRAYKDQNCKSWEKFKSLTSYFLGEKS